VVTDESRGRTDADMPRHAAKSAAGRRQRARLAEPLAAHETEEQRRIAAQHVYHAVMAGGEGNAARTDFCAIKKCQACKDEGW